MPATQKSTNGRRYQVEYPQWTQKQKREWVQTMAKLCVETYLDTKRLSRLHNGSTTR